MSVLFVNILIVLSDSQAQSGTPISGMICGYGGSNLNTSYTFSVAEVPDRCEAIIYGGTRFHTKPSDADINAIAALVSAGHTVYMSYFPEIKDDSLVVIDTNNASSIGTHIAPMLAVLNENKVSGVILGFLSLHSEIVSDYTPKIKTLISVIKECVSNIKVGLRIDGFKAANFANKNIFDFTIVNDIVDVYVVDTSTVGDFCKPDSVANGGRFPIKSTDPSIVSLEDILSATQSSAMDQNKILINLVNQATVSPELYTDEFRSYSEYCCRTDSNVWCADSIDILYNRVIFFKSVFKGVTLSYLEFDDYNGTCGCGKYPVANNYMDAWDGKPMTCCEKIG